MKKIGLPLICLLLGLVLLFPSCKKKAEEASPQFYRIGLVSGLGGFSDRGFNQNMLEGLQQAVNKYPVYGAAYACHTVEDFAAGIEYFRSNGYNLIITAGFDAASATISAANANPAIDFMILDYTMTSPPANLLCGVFDVDQSAFPCGFLAACWASRQNQSNPVAGFVAGPEIPEIRQFSVSYAHGVEYFNTLYNKNVLCRGYYASSFTDTLQGAKLADSLMHQGVSVVFAFAGKTGNGALYKMHEAGQWAIGVDVDQYISIPQVGPSLLTSCMKGLNVMIFDVVEKYYLNNSFQGGTTIHGNLVNQGVGMAPFHDFDATIPDSIKTELTKIKTGIADGSIPTGWPE